MLKRVQQLSLKSRCFQLFGAVRMVFSCFVAALQDPDAASRCPFARLVSMSSRERCGVRDIPGKALRVIPRGKRRLTVYRAHHVKIAGNDS